MKLETSLIAPVPSAKKAYGHIEIVRSLSIRLSSLSISSAESIKKVLESRYATVTITTVETVSDLKQLVLRKPDLVILGMKLILLEPEKGYDDSRKLWLTDYLDKYGINFTGSETGALKIEFDKPLAKQLVTSAGLNSPSFFVSKIGSHNTQHDLKYPLFVKPSNRGGSLGIDENSVVYNQTQLDSKIESIHKIHLSDALVEEYLAGREFSVAVIAQPHSNKCLALPIEIISPIDLKGNEFLSVATKESDTEKVLPVTDQDIKDSIEELALGVFKALGSRDYGRIDMRLDSNGIPSFIEANLIPGLSNHGYLSRCYALNLEIEYPEMILSLVKLALGRVKPLKTPVTPRVFSRVINIPEVNRIALATSKY